MRIYLMLKKDRGRTENSLRGILVFYKDAHPIA
uniref:Uncharacterized protein n=1 Tax=Vibrio parahaemolyticus TaxID=670 RepID=A0A7M1W0T5_VIBPH|nr:hypothetical protein VP145_00006 [Vibrio parahaemolyticus]QOS15176.1 hypothetical protein VP383_00006 [Vibrio parahaemolyticus]QOS15496.1 hypothetical protein VP1_00006 [Vibrio parahaemolyticus]QOS16023.1 hypothetical protein VP144_00006 [Vibrio parahaemolyticus]QOS16558.1 hypothetical protein VP410_00006 [Vibrio parahaemolyticus]